MEVIELKGNGQLRTGRTELDVPHLGKTLTFVLPLIGPNYHRDVMQGIDSQGLYRPTTAQIFSLVDLALQNPDEPHCAEIRNRFKNNYLWTGTETLSFPDGVLVYDNIDGKMPQTSEGLIKLADAGDKRVRLVEPDFETGWMPIPKFLKNPKTIAQVGEEMIPIVERVAKACYKREAGVWSLGKQSSDTNRQTAVCSGGDYGRLYLYSDCHDGDGVGFGSGVLK